MSGSGSSIRREDRRGDPALRAFAGDVRSGLGATGQKTLPCRYLYDDLGSALFEAITYLPEYGPTRADLRLLTGHAGDIARRFTASPLVVELGSGSGRKTRPLLQAFSRLGPIDYRPIDVSAAALRACVADLSPVARVSPIVGDYFEGLQQAITARHGRRVLLLFLGGTIGNFDPAERAAFLAGIARQLAPGDQFLFGADLVTDAERLLPAYDDPPGVTAAFDKNLLARVNRELGADFDLDLFEHVAAFDARHSRVEMHLRAKRAQRVSIPAARLAIDLAAGETIWTESSYKFKGDEVRAWSVDFGFRGVAQWIDAEWQFSENLWERGFNQPRS